MAPILFLLSCISLSEKDLISTFSPPHIGASHKSYESNRFRSLHLTSVYLFMLSDAVLSERAIMQPALPPCVKENTLFMLVSENVVYVTTTPRGYTTVVACSSLFGADKGTYEKGKKIT